MTSPQTSFDNDAAYSIDFPIIFPDDQDVGLDEMNLSGSPKSLASIYVCPNNNAFKEVASVCWSDTMNQCSTHPKVAGPLVANVDLECLNPGAFLNDTIIEFGLKTWLKDLEISNPELTDQIYVFSSFFYQKLNSEPELQVAYENVSKWTKRHDIFQKRYIIVPINERYVLPVVPSATIHRHSLHWYLAIIYEPEHVIRNRPVDKTYIFTLDSLGSQHPQALMNLTAYLRMEAKYKKGIEATGIIEGKTAVVPYQTNHCDCGVYLLHFARTFFSDPRKYASIILSSPQLVHDTKRRAIWLVDTCFEPREQLRLRIEALSTKLQDRPLKSGMDDDSEGEVEIM